MCACCGEVEYHAVHGTVYQYAYAIFPPRPGGLVGVPKKASDFGRVLFFAALHQAFICIM